MLYHQQFKGLTHVIISCFTSVEIIMVPNSLIHTLQSEKFQQNNAVGDGFSMDVADEIVTLSPTLLRFLVEISEFQLAFMMIVLYF